MKLSHVHLQFWQACKASPGWASHIGVGRYHAANKTPGDYINGCVNAHASRVDWPKIHTGNTLHIVQSRAKREPLREVLRELAISGDCVADPRRRANCRKWLERIERPHKQ